MDWSSNIPTSGSRPAKRRSGFPSFFELIGWGFIAFFAWFLFTLFSPPIMQQMFGPLLIFFGFWIAVFLIVGFALRALWQIITWPFRGK